jgi:hypothetical protein
MSGNNFKSYHNGILRASGGLVPGVSVAELDIQSHPEPLPTVCNGTWPGILPAQWADEAETSQGGECELAVTTCSGPSRLHRASADGMITKP